LHREACDIARISRAAAGNAMKRSGQTLPPVAGTGGSTAPSDPNPDSTVLAESERPLTAFLGRVGGWRLAAILVINQTLILVVTGLTASTWGPREPFKGSWDELVIVGRDLVSRILSNWQRWDALWYQHVAESGYGPNDGSTAFFPLYPLLSRGLSFGVGGNVVAAELIVSGAAYFGALWLLWKLVRLEVPGLAERLTGSPDRRALHLVLVPALVVLLTALAPAGFFFLAPFTESLFLLLTVASFWLMRTGRLWAAGAVGFAASLTRVQGVLLLVPLAYEYLRARGTIDWALGRLGRPPGAGFLAAALPIAGVACLYAYQALVVGAEGVGFGAQAPWGYRVVAPWDAIASSLGYIGAGAGSPAAWIEVLNLVSLAGFAAMALVSLRRLPLAYALYVIPSVALLLFRETWFSPLMSVSRYVLVLFPATLVLALWLAPRPRLAAAWLAASFIAQLVLFQYWVRWGFVA
jgi:hypothetical protein